MTTHTNQPDAFKHMNNLQTLSVGLKAAVAGLAILLLASCAAAGKLKEMGAANDYELPAVENPDSAATIKVKKADNPSEIQFMHLMLLDGETFMKLKEGDKREFQLDPGTYQLKVTCHSIPNPKISSFPVDLSVVDGSDDLELVVDEGDELCLKISKPLMSCAKVEESALSICE